MESISVKILVTPHVPIGQIPNLSTASLQQHLTIIMKIDTYNACVYHPPFQIHDKTQTSCISFNILYIKHLGNKIYVCLYKDTRFKEEFIKGTSIIFMCNEKHK